MRVAILDDIHQAWENTEGVRRLRDRAEVVVFTGAVQRSRRAARLRCGDRQPRTDALHSHAARAALRRAGPRADRQPREPCRLRGGARLRHRRRQGVGRAFHRRRRAHVRSGDGGDAADPGQRCRAQAGGVAGAVDAGAAWQDPRGRGPRQNRPACRADRKGVRDAGRRLGSHADRRGGGRRRRRTPRARRPAGRGGHRDDSRVPVALLARPARRTAHRPDEADRVPHQHRAGSRSSTRRPSSTPSRRGASPAPASTSSTRSLCRPGIRSRRSRTSCSRPTSAGRPTTATSASPRRRATCCSTTWPAAPCRGSKDTEPKALWR